MHPRKVQLAMNPGNDDTLRDLIGIGALNIDYIATRERLLQVDPATIAEFSNRFEHGSERPVDEDEINRTLREMGVAVFETHLGGSSFNTIHALASLQLPLKIGFVGVAGGAVGPSPNFLDWFASHKVDDRYVRGRPKAQAGVCISYIHDGERSMLTYPGVNVEMATHLKESIAELKSYLGRCKMLHVTSFFDDETPAVLSELLQAAKEQNPWLRISFDPGHHWVRDKAQEINPILRCTDFLFLNDREFKDLGHYRPGRPDEQVAQSIFEVCSPATVLLVLKRYDHIALFTRVEGRTLSHRYSNVVLPPEQIEDSTGAGDVFAAGFAAAMLTPGLELRHGVQLGLRLVREKLLAGGTRAFRKFPALLESFLDEATSQHRTGPCVPGSGAGEEGGFVYLTCAKGPVGASMEAHLQKSGLKVKQCQASPSPGRYRIDDLVEFLDCCTFAILVYDSEHEAGESRQGRRERIAHEIGLFQGRLGFTRVVLLVPEGSRDSLCLDGVQRVIFRQNARA